MDNGSSTHDKFQDEQNGPAKRQSGEDHAIVALRDAILDGHLEAGSRITEIGLSKMLNQTRGAVRAALNYVSQEGLVIKVPYTGWTVMPLSSIDAWELYTLRANLEMLASSLASQHLDRERAEQISQAFETLVDAARKKNTHAVAEADFKLHKAIVIASGHRRLMQQYRLIEQQIRVYIISSDNIADDFEMFLEHHRPIVEAILSRDAETAARLSSEHNLSEGDKLFKHLLKLEWSHKTPPTQKKSV